MSFNQSDLSKQVQEVVFNRKPKPVNNLGVTLDKRLTFEVHFKIVLSITNRTTGLVRKSQSLLPRNPLSDHTLQL